MDAQEKIEYVRKNISEMVQTSPSGPILLRLYSVGHPDNPEEWTILTVGEQKRILQKLEEDGEIKNLEWSGDRGAMFLPVLRTTKSPEKIRRSNILSHIKTTDELLRHRELFEKFLNMIGNIKNIHANHYYKLPTEEENDDLIQLLMDLKVVDYDWGEMAKQTHRQVGNRIIEFGFEGDKVLQLHARVSGKNGIIKREALELISKDIGERFTLTKIIQLFGDLGVPESMFIQDTKWRAVFYVLSFYATAKSHEGIVHTLKTIQGFLHPLMFAGDEKIAKQTREKYKQWLKYDHISIDDEGKVYLGPTEEEERQGAEDWIDADGEVIEPSGYAIFPNEVASLWTLLSQIVVVVSAYQNNPTLNRTELEKLYLELIGKAEELIENAHVGQIKETYKRPFTSLHTAEIEARAKGLDDPVGLISTLLVDISRLKPHPAEIAKAIEHNSKLIERVARATNAEDFRPEVLELKNKTQIIKDFNACNFADLKTDEKIYLLKVLFSYYSEIISTYYGSGLFFLTSGIDDLNDYFKVLRKRMIEVIESDKTFLELKEGETYGSIIQPLTSLYSGAEFLDGIWEDYTQPAITSFREEIADKDLFINNSEIHKTYTAVPRFLEAVSGEIESLKKYLGAKTKNFYANDLPNIADNLGEGNTKQITGEKVLAKKKTTLPKFPFTIPSGTRWESIAIMFTDSEFVNIRVAGHSHPTGYADMGFVDKRTHKPNLQWTLLLVLAKHGGALSSSSGDARDNFKKHKQLLSDKLKGYFGIDYDPFEPYSSSGGYKIKMTLVPPTLKNTIPTQVTNENEVEEMFREISEE